MGGGIRGERGILRHTGALCMEEKRGSWVMGTSASLLLLVGFELFFLPMAFMCVSLCLGWLAVEEQQAVWKILKCVLACVCVCVCV